MAATIASTDKPPRSTAPLSAGMEEWDAFLRSRYREGRSEEGVSPV
jgi:hypothetical protein